MDYGLKNERFIQMNGLCQVVLRQFVVVEFQQGYIHVVQQLRVNLLS